MAELSEIKVFNIARPRVDREEVQRWLDHLGVKGDIGMAQATDAQLLVGLPAKRCYNSFEPGLNPNVTKVRKDWCEYIENILKSGHGSVLEHAGWTWAIEGCSRVFTAEMNRHRAGVAISEASMRYIRFDGDIPWYLPNSLKPAKWWSDGYGDAIRWEDRGDGITRVTTPSNGDTDSWNLPKGVSVQDFVLERKKWRTRAAIQGIFDSVSEQYSYLVNKVWEEEMSETSAFKTKKLLTSALRRIVPLGVSTGAVYTINARALRHIMALRGSPHAEEEICYVMSMIGKRMIEMEPSIFGDFTQDENGFYIPKYPKV